LSGDCVKDTFSVVVHSKERTLGTIATDAGGNGSGSFALPCAVNVGTHTVIATDALGNSGSAPLRVRPAPCASAPGHKKGGKPPRGHHPHQDMRVAGVKATAAMPAGAAAVGVAGLLILNGRKRRQRRDFTR
jgi:hypothetical protein